MNYLRSFRNSLLICLALIALPSIVYILFFQRYMKDGYEKYAFQTNISQIQSASEAMKDVSASIANECIRQTIDYRLQSLSRIRNYDQLYETADIALVCNRYIDNLAAIVDTSDLIDSIYIYFDNADYIISSELTAVRLDRFPDMGWQAEYALFHSGDGNAQPYFARKVGTLGVRRDVITTFWDMGYYTSFIDGSLIMNLNSAEIVNMLNLGSTDNSSCMVLNSAGDVIVSSGAEGGEFEVPLADVKAILDANPNITGYSALPGYRLITFYREPSTRWTIVRETRLTSVMERFTSMTIGTAVFVMIMGAVLLSVFEIARRRMYSPLRQLLHNIKSDTSAHPTDDDMAISAYRTLIRMDESEIDSSQSPHELQQALAGDEYSPDSFGLDIDALTCVALFGIDCFSEFKAAYPREMRKYVYLMFSQMAMQAFEKCIPVKIDDSQFCLIFAAAGDPPDSDALHSNIERLQHEFLRITNSSVSAGYAVGGALQLHELYMYAACALDERFLNGRGSICRYTVEADRPLNYAYPIAYEHAIFEAMQSGKVRDTLDQFDSFVDNVRSQPSISAQLARQYFDTLCANANQLLAVNQPGGVDALNLGRLTSDTVMHSEYIDDACCALRAHFSESAAHYCSGRSADDPVAKIKAFIEENYKNDIDISIVAREIGLSYSYARKLFQDGTGKSIVDYINEIRIGKSKYLLLNTRCSARQISQMVGYNNEQAFTRMFKKFESVSPSAFRQLREHEESSSAALDIQSEEKVGCQ